MKNYQVYFFDIDGTLAFSKQDISKRMSELLTRLAKHKKVALISGASLEQMQKKVIDKLDSKTNFRNIILLPTSGAALFVYKNHKWGNIYSNEIVNSITEIEKHIRDSFSENGIKIPKESYGEKIEHRGSQITFSALGQEAPLKLKDKWDPKNHKRTKVVKSLTLKLPDLDHRVGGTTSIDITLKGIDKSFGINEAVKYLNINPKRCVFVGDKIFPGGNDFPATETGVGIVETSGPRKTEKIIKEFLGQNVKNDNLFIKIYHWIRKVLFAIYDLIYNFINLFVKLFKPRKSSPMLGEIYFEDQSRDGIYVTRHHKNPVLSPSSYAWENEGVFNPAAIYLEGRVHLLYRAMGSDGTSTIGYASSEDGIHFDDRLSHPVYYPKADFELDPQNPEQKFNPDKYASGGGWCGCEDPKVCRIGDRIFLNYVAFSGWDSVRVALSSISVEDFLNKNWNWTEPILCSKKGVISKSGGLFPEKINGKYVFFQRIFPDILIDYFDDLRFDKKEQEHGKHRIPPRKKGWDSRKVSFGSTPIKTKHGWLVITHGVDDAADHQYHMGAMLLDLKNPEKVLYRSEEPILSPELWYENDWKPGVVYPCGAVNKDGTLLIYYGGGDKYVCVASAPFDDFVSSLIKTHKPKVRKVKRLKISLKK